MKILVPGREQQGWAREFECTGKGNGGGGCGATLLVEQPDLFLTENYAHGETDIFVTFRCIQCGVDTDLDNRDIPANNVPIPSKRAWLARHKPINQSAELWGMRNP